MAIIKSVNAIFFIFECYFGVKYESLNNNTKALKNQSCVVLMHLFLLKQLRLVK